MAFRLLMRGGIYIIFIFGVIARKVMMNHTKKKRREIRRSQRKSDPEDIVQQG